MVDQQPGGVHQPAGRRLVQIMDIFSRSNRFSRSISMFRSVHRQQTGERARSQLHGGRG